MPNNPSGRREIINDLINSLDRMQQRMQQRIEGRFTEVRTNDPRVPVIHILSGHNWRTVDLNSATNNINSPMNYDFEKYENEINTFPRIKNTASEECPICLEAPNQFVQLKCMHNICETCIINTLVYSFTEKRPFQCSMCRKDVVSEASRFENDFFDTDDDYSDDSSD